MFDTNYVVNKNKMKNDHKLLLLALNMVIILYVWDLRRSIVPASVCKSSLDVYNIPIEF